MHMNSSEIDLGIAYRQPGNRRVLVVDDNQALAENIAELLAEGGHTTDVAFTAEAALSKALESDVDVVITDFRLPGMNGAELVVCLRRERKGFYAVVVSAYNDDNTITAASEAGAAFLSKPLNLAGLSDFIGRAVAQA
jgi:DNA-binding response OmpR family regulator